MFTQALISNLRVNSTMEVLRTEHRDILNMLLTVGRYNLQISMYRNSNFNICDHLSRIGGIWSAVDPPLAIQRFIYNVYSFIARFSLWTLAGTMSADIIYNMDDMLAVSDAGAFLAGLLAVITKVTVFQRHSKEIRRLIDMVYGPIDTMVMAKGTECLLDIEVESTAK